MDRIHEGVSSQNVSLRSKMTQSYTVVVYTYCYTTKGKYRQFSVENQRQRMAYSISKAALRPVFDKIALVLLCCIKMHCMTHHP